jgi:hypothetical protein
MRPLQQGTCSDSECWSLATEERESVRCDDQHFGNILGETKDDVFRLAFLNVATFPALKSDPRNGTARAAFKKWQIDVWEWVEMNVNWVLVKNDDKL